MLRPSISALYGVALAGLLVQAQVPSAPPASPQTPPTFRAGVDLVQLDVLVLDRDRRPVRGLTAADFAVLESGRPQRIDVFNEVEIPSPPTTGAAWTREVGSDLSSNDVKTRRLVMIVMDDGFTGVENGESKRAREIARSAIDQLGPQDLAAVIFTYMGHFQNFTADRVKLRAAVESFTPRYYPGSNLGSGQMAPVPLGCTFRSGGAGCQVNALRRAADALRLSPPGRKTLLMITPGMVADMSNPDSGTKLPQIKEMFQALQLANIGVYTLDPRGLLTGGFSPDVTEVALAESTGGRRIVNTNAPEQLVPAIFQENSSYYLLGYRSTSTGTRFRPIQVTVNRPGVEVRTRSGFYGSPPDKRSDKPARSPIDTALERGLPTGDLPLLVSAVTFAVPGRRQAEVVLVSRVEESVGGEPTRPRRVAVVAAAFDTGWPSRGVSRQTLEVVPAPGAAEAGTFAYEVQSRLPLAPGRYEVRVGVESDGRVGSTFVDVEVPDFAKARLAVSSLVLSRSPAILQAGQDMAAALGAVAPTNARTFGRDDKVEAFLRVYQGGSGALAPISVNIRIVDDTDRAVVDERTTVGADRFAKDRAADVRFLLPLARLAVGEYLLTLEAAAGPRQVERRVRFAVR